RALRVSGRAEPDVLAALVFVQQRPDADAGVDDILAVVAGVVPAAGDVQGIVAARIGQTGDVVVALIHALAHVAGWARPLLVAGVRHRDLDAAAVLIEI